MKIAVISDIHGNLEALNSVVADIESLKIKKIFVCGDLAMAGPEPLQTIDRIKELAEKYEVNIVQGNTDLMIVNYFNTKDEKYLPPNDVMAESLKFAASILDSSYVNYLADIPFSYSEEFSFGKVKLVHGSPRRNNEDILPEIPLEFLKEAIAGTSEDVIFCGHTHLPVIHKLDGQMVVNVGSVGRPFTEEPKACYAVLEIEDRDFNVYHRFVDYDYQLAANKLAALNFDGSDKLAAMLIKATSRYPQ